MHLAKTNNAGLVDDDRRRMRNDVFIVNFISFHHDQALIGSKWKSDAQTFMPLLSFFRRIAVNADEHSVMLFNLRKILLQLAELLLAPGSPQAAAKKFEHDVFLAAKISETNFFAVGSGHHKARRSAADRHVNRRVVRGQFVGEIDGQRAGLFIKFPSAANAGEKGFRGDIKSWPSFSRASFSPMV